MRKPIQILGFVLALGASPLIHAQVSASGSNVLSVTNLQGKATGVAPVSDGSLVVVGNTSSSTFPEGYAGAGDYPFVARLSADKSKFLYTVLFKPGMSTITAVAVDQAGNAYVAVKPAALGNVVDAPVTLRSGSCVCAVIVKLDATGRVAYNTEIGVAVQAIAVDAAGSAYLAGTGDGERAVTTIPAAKTTGGAAVLKLNASGNALIYTTVFGGTGPPITGYASQASSIAIDSTGRAYIAGVAGSADFPVTPGAFQTTGQPGSGFAVRLSADGSHLEYATFLPGVQTVFGTGTCDHGQGAGRISIAANAAGEAYIAGCTESPNFPTTPGAYRTGHTPGPYLGATFVSKLNAAGTSLVYSALIAPAATDVGNVALPIGLAVDATGNAFFAGPTFAPLPVVNAVEPSFPSVALCPVYFTAGVLEYQRICDQGFVAGLDPTGSKLIFSTYLTGGGTLHGDTVPAMALDAAGNLVIAGIAASDLTNLFPPTGLSLGLITTLNPHVSPPFFTSDSITNGADFGVGGAREGGLASIFCTGLTGIAGDVRASGYPLPTQLAGVSVLVNSTPAPLVSISDFGGYQQINFQTPADTANYGLTVVFVQQNGRTAAVAGLSLNLAPPGLFTLDGIHAIAQHASDFSLVTASNPARPGEIVTIYVSGLGPKSPAVPLGVPAPLSPVSTSVDTPTVLIQQQTARVLFAGAAPGMLGVDQINLQIPAGIAPGDLDLVVTLPYYAIWIPVPTNAGIPGRITPASKTAKISIGN